MQYQKFNLGAYHLHVIKTDKFRTIQVEIDFRRPVEKKDITYRNFLTDMLVFSTKKYPTKKRLAIEAENLYEVKINTLNSRIGRFVNTAFQMQFLNERYTEPGMFQKCMDFLMEILFRPNVMSGKFDQTSFDIVKMGLENEIKSIKDDPKRYSWIRMLETMGTDEPYTLRGIGYLDDLMTVTPTNLYDYYQEMLKTDLIDIFVVGDVDVDQMKEFFKQNFQVNTIKKPKTDVFLQHNKKDVQEKEIIESEDIMQSKLTMGCKLFDLTEFERQYVLPCYCYILGGPSNSKLFNVVREKNSLAYYIIATTKSVDNIMMIYSGIAADSLQDVVRLTKEQMQEMEQGKFEEQQLASAKKEFLASLQTVLDNPKQIINMYFSSELLGSDLVDQRAKKIEKVTHDDIVKLSKKIKLDTIYLLKERGNLNGEEDHSAA